MKCCLRLIVLFLTCPGMHASAQEISYTVSPFHKNGPASFLVELVLKGNASGKTILSIPYSTDGQYRPQDQVEILKVLNSKGSRVMKDDSSRYIIEHKPNARLTVQYRIKTALADTLPGNEEIYAQMLTSKYYYLFGWDAWITPEDSSTNPYRIKIYWKSFPNGWSHLNSYGANRPKQQMDISLEDFRNAIYMGGDIRIYTGQINNHPLYLGIRGNWSFSDQELFDVVRRTVTAQRAFWNDYTISSFTVSLIPMKYDSENVRSINGRGLNNTFVTIGTNTKAFRIQDLFSLYNHEFMHHWFGTILKQTQPENAYKWFHEGFTDYFAYTAMMEEGLLTADQYKKNINGILASYYGDSTNQWPNKRLAQEYWSSYQWHQLPYKRGLIFALYLDEFIKKQTNNLASLKTVIQQMLATARQDGKSFSQDFFVQLLNDKTGKDCTPLLEEYITNGTFIPMKEWERATTKLALTPVEVFDLGFATDKGGVAMDAIVNAVKEASNSQKAGLLIGDKIVGYSYTNLSEPATIVVKRGEEKIKISFLPAGQIVAPQLK